MKESVRVVSSFVTLMAIFKPIHYLQLALISSSKQPRQMAKESNYRYGTPQVPKHLNQLYQHTTRMLMQ
jgi:hypothetical protein